MQTCGLIGVRCIRHRLRGAWEPDAETRCCILPPCALVSRASTVGRKVEPARLLETSISCPRTDLLSACVDHGAGGPDREEKPGCAAAPTGPVRSLALANPSRQSAADRVHVAESFRHAYPTAL